MKKLIRSLIILAVIAAIPILLLGYLGFIPAVSKLLGTSKPRDLGMVYSAKDFNSALQKSKVEMKELDASAPLSVTYEGSHEVKTSFTDEELTSHAYNRDWVDYPISDVQVRINDDNTCEVSGMIDLTKMGRYVSMLGVSQEDYEAALKEVKIPLSTIPFYAKGFGTAANDAFVEASLTNFEVGRFPVPSSLIEQYKEPLIQFGNVIIKSIPGLSVKEAKFENGSIYFDGTLPNIEYTKRL